jgi:DNA-binding response OmpR family regulator
VRVLVVDDDAVIRSLLVVTLSVEGFSVSQATRGQEALDRLALSPVDVLVLDAEMPDMSGLEVATALRRLNRTKILLLGRAAGIDCRDVDACLPKPFEPNEFVAAVRALAAPRRNQWVDGDARRDGAS